MGRRKRRNNRKNQKGNNNKKDEDKEEIPYTATGVLDSQEQARDIKISSFSVSLNGVNLVTDTTLGKRLVPIPDFMDIHHFDWFFFFFF